MNETQVRGFIKTVECGSMAGAAKELFVTPQALQEQIKRLEDEVGVRLLVRSRTGCAPTEAGRTFFRGVSRIVPEMEALVASTIEVDRRDQATLVAAYSGIINDGLFGDVLASFSRMRPDLRMVMRRVAFADTGSYDIVNGDVGFAPGAYVEINHVSACCYAVLRATHPLLDALDESGCLPTEKLGRIGLHVPSQRLPNAIEPQCIRQLLEHADIEEYSPIDRDPNVTIALITHDDIMLCYGPSRLAFEHLVQVRLADSQFRYSVFRRDDGEKPYSKEFCTYMRSRYRHDWASHVARIEEATRPR